VVTKRLDVAQDTSLDFCRTKNSRNHGENDMTEEHMPDTPYRRCLNHGFVGLVDTFGTDESIVQAARVSYGKGTKGSSSDAALISYLLRQRHTSPFEMVEMKFICRMPIFVARQWIRHRTANVNEYSGRYSEMKPYFYEPHLGAIAFQSETNKQGRDEDILSMVARVDIDEVRLALEEQLAQMDNRSTCPTQKLWDKRLACLECLPDEMAEARKIAATIKVNNLLCWDRYQSLLDRNVAREMARVVLPLTMYTEWYWKMDLHNLMHFLRLRLDPHAQAEIRVYAEAIAEFVQEDFPLTWEVFQDMNDGCFLTGQERKGISYIVSEQISPTYPDEMLTCVLERFMIGEGFSERRIKELKQKMGMY